MIVSSLSSEFVSVLTPWRRRSEADCQVITLWEKDVNEEPCAAVENTGCRRTPLRNKSIEGDGEGRKKEMCEMTVELRIVDSKLPGSMIEVGGEISSAFSLVSCSMAASLCRFCERFKFLLKSMCSNNGVKGSKRYGKEDDIVRANALYEIPPSFSSGENAEMIQSASF